MVKDAWRELYPFKSHGLKLDDHALHYLDEGNPSAPVLLFVHGNPTWSFYWRALITEFKSQFRCVAPDHLGCGLSDKPRHWPYRLQNHIDNLEHLITALDLRNITLVMHDWGGAIGMGTAARMPHRIKRLVVFNTAAFLSTQMPWRIAMCRIPVLGTVSVRMLNGFSLAATVMATEKGLSRLVKQGLLAPYDSFDHRIAVHRFVQDIPMHPSHPSHATVQAVEAGLAQFIHHPMLILWGEKDWCFTPAFREEWQKRFPAAEVHPIADAGHYVVEDAIDIVKPLMRNFLVRTAS